MRISKTQQASNKRLILQTAVDLMTQQAFEDALAQWRATPGQAEWSLQERLQLLMLGGGLPGRDLLKLARRGVAGAAR